MAKLVNKTYGDALFDLAVSEGKTDTLFQEAVELREIFGDNPDLLKLLTNPRIEKNEKIQIVANIFGGRASEEILGFLNIIITKDRQKYIDGILDYFIARAKEYKKIGVVYVTTAIELNKENKDKIENKLLSTTDYESLEMNYTVDEDVIGGMIIKIGDRVVDSTIRTKLEKLSKQLSDVQV